MEKWKVISRHPTYEVSNMGRVRNRKSGHILATNPTKSHPKPQVWLYCSLFRTTLQYNLARVVFDAFNDCHTSKIIRYRDNNPMNCKLDNLYVKL